MNITTTMLIDRTVTLSATYIPLTKARTYGPPECCYPAEGDEMRDIVATLDGETIELTKEERERAEEELRDAIPERD